MDHAIIRELDRCAPNEHQVLLVNTINGKERAVVHYWAQERNLHHTPVRTTRFKRVNAYYCCICKKINYGRIIWCCDYCDDIVRIECTTNGCKGQYYEYPDWDLHVNTMNLRLKPAFNAVLVAHELPELQKRTYRHWPRGRAIPEGVPDLNKLSLGSIMELFDKEGFQLNE